MLEHRHIIIRATVKKPPTDVDKIKINPAKQNFEVILIVETRINNPKTPPTPNPL